MLRISAVRAERQPSTSMKLRQARMADPAFVMVVVDAGTQARRHATFGTCVECSWKRANTRDIADERNMRGLRCPSHKKKVPRPCALSCERYSTPT